MTAPIIDAPRLTLAEAARRLGVHVSTLHRWRLKKGLRFVRIGGRSYVLVRDLDDWIAGLSDPPAKAETDRDLTERAARANEIAQAMGL